MITLTKRRYIYVKEALHSRACLLVGYFVIEPIVYFILFRIMCFHEESCLWGTQDTIFISNLYVNGMERLAQSVQVGLKLPFV